VEIYIAIISMYNIRQNQQGCTVRSIALKQSNNSHSDLLVNKPHPSNQKNKHA